MTHDQFHKMFDSFFNGLTERMHPPHRWEDGHLERYWHERFIEALEHKKPSLRNESYTELAVMWLKAYQQQQEIIDQLEEQIAKLKKAT